MSEAFEKVSGLERLALFPLPLVMLPFEVLPLHIFEDRYRALLRDVLDDRSLFGVSFLGPDDSGAERPQIGSVGCVAEVRETKMLPDGRSNIVTFGLIRYRINDYAETGRPYLVAEVDFFEDEPDDGTALEATADEVFRLFERTANAALRLSGSLRPQLEIKRSEPEPLSFLAAAALNLDNDLKYSLLEMTSTVERLEKLRDILRTVAEGLEANVDLNQLAKKNGHDKRGVDL